MGSSNQALVYLTVDDVLSFYAVLFAYTEQQAADQLRGRATLEGALARPQQYAHYAGADLALQAAVLAHGIAEGQPFVEGNKRTALASLRAFLLANGYQISATQEERANWIIRLSEGASPDDLAGWIRASLVPVPDPEG